VTGFTFDGISDAAQSLERTRETIAQSQRASVTLSRQQTLDDVFLAYREADEQWKVAEGETPVSEEVMATTCQFVEALPIGVRSPSVVREPDGHISLEWYRNPRRMMTVSIGPDGRLHWAALLGSEDPRGTGIFVGRIPKTILHCIYRVFS
jgi:hypothetical protein